MAHAFPVRRRTEAPLRRAAAHRSVADVEHFVLPVVLALGTLVIVLAMVAETVLPDIRNADLILVVAVLDSCAAAFAGLMAQGRFRRDRRLQDAALSIGLRLLAVTGFVEVLLHVFGLTQPLVPLALRIAGATAIVVGGVAPTARRLRRLSPMQNLLLGPAVGLVALVPVLVVAPLVPLDPDGDGAPLERLIPGLDFLRPGDALIGGLIVVAALGFWVRGVRARDHFLLVLGLAFALGAAARFDFFLYPALHVDTFSAGDVLRTGCYALILVAAFREAQGYWTARVELSMLEDRRRIARELHDGVVQELAYMRLEASGMDDLRGDRIVAAADRALDESRSAVHALDGDADARLDGALRESLTEMATRYGFALELETAALPAASADERHAVLRIAREAVGNAARNGHASTVRVTLRGDGTDRVLEIQDDGDGFDPAAVGRGYGLRSMRERAAALGGLWSVDSAPGRGTTVRTIW